MTNAAIRKVFAPSKAGSLHKALNVPAGQKLPKGKLLWAVRNITDKQLRTRAVLVLKFHHNITVDAK